MKFSEIIQLPIGTKVFRITNGSIKAFTFLALHPKYPDKYAYFINDYNVHESIGVYITNELEKTNVSWETDYDIAKEIMWTQLENNMRSVNKIYFDNKKIIG